MRRMIALGTSVLGLLIIGAVVTDAAPTPTMTNGFSGHQSLINKVIAGTDCAVCCEWASSQGNCTKWCKTPCGDIIVLKNTYVNKLTNKPVQFKRIPGIDAAGSMKKAR